MKRLLVEPDFAEWREAAREALRAGYDPAEIDFEDATAPSSLSLGLEMDELPTGEPVPKPHVPRDFLETAKVVAVHRDAARWNLLYRVLYRLQTAPNLMRIEVDPDVVELLRLSAQVRRDVHKMEAFLRFRKVMEPGAIADRPVVVDEPVLVSAEARAPQEHHLVLEADTPFGPVRHEIEACGPEEAGSDAGCEHYIAWYQPDHRIVPLVAPFFRERFGILRWTVMTPDESVAWDPVTQELTFGPGLPREAAPAEDELEDLWRSYYASIFNPARLNPRAMKSEMPVRFWKNLPEIDMVPGLMKKAEARVEGMVARQKTQPSAQPYLPDDHSLASLRTALPHCRGCELYRHATHVVPGEGLEASRLMLVGEQPGDQEDLEGKPFVGPAGKLLRKAMAELGIDPAQVYVTNAVKHFKFVQRGKLRLHQNPRMSEISACRPWLLAEIETVKPRIILCLGASASKSLLGGTFALMKDRGKLLESPHGAPVMATVHPSAVLRARDEAAREELMGFLKMDLRRAWELGQRA
jgi:DNA polymerase